jgi:hypothetical protein
MKQISNICFSRNGKEIDKENDGNFSVTNITDEQ